MIRIPPSYNYCSAFLTFACTFKCPYCINKYNGLYQYRQMVVGDWITALNRISTRSGLPITISGGEPTVYPFFYKLVNNIDRKTPLDLLTNGDFDPKVFVKNIDPNRFKRDAKYASIRFSYHPGQTNIKKLISDVLYMQNLSYSVGIWAVDVPKDYWKIRFVQRIAQSFGIDFRLKDYLDEKNGDYKYPQAVDGVAKKCLCKPSELLIAPDGRLFRCHFDLYHARNSYGHILDKDISLPTDFLPCESMGFCSPCDVKTKFSRHQEWGHCSVEIKETE